MRLYAENDCMQLYHGKAEEGLPLPDAFADSFVSDPPSGIKWMNCKWDSDKGGRSTWIAWATLAFKEAYRLLKPGACGLVWALPRQSHWTATALEDAGFKLLDVVHHVYAEGFPKGQDIGAAIDKKFGLERKVVGVKNNTYDGCARDPLAHSNPSADASFGSWGLKKTPHGLPLTEPSSPEAKKWTGFNSTLKPAAEHWWLIRKPISEASLVDNVLKHGVGALNIDACRLESGRYPSNIVQDGSGLFGEKSAFFYAAKPGKSERNAGCSTPNNHPTLKSRALMDYLVRLVTPPKGLVLDLFCGSGTTGLSALTQGMDFIGVDETEDYLRITKERLEHLLRSLPTR